MSWSGVKSNAMEVDRPDSAGDETVNVQVVHEIEQHTSPGGGWTGMLGRSKTLSQQAVEKRDEANRASEAANDLETKHKAAKTGAEKMALKQEWKDMTRVAQDLHKEEADLHEQAIREEHNTSAWGGMLGKTKCKSAQAVEKRMLAAQAAEEAKGHEEELRAAKAGPAKEELRVKMQEKAAEAEKLKQEEEELHKDAVDERKVEANKKGGGVLSMISCGCLD